MSAYLNSDLCYKKKKMYVLGFLFSVILTVIPFFMVIEKFFSNDINYGIIVLCAVMQIFFHFVYFLDVNFSKKSRLNIMSLLFVMIIIFIVMFGSIWIMFNLNHHMFTMH